jgi:K+-sensing histidine kinase KdpD
VSHDLRNQLNAVELQSAFLAELGTDAELKAEISRLRKMVSECGIALQKLSTRLNPPSAHPTVYGARDLVEDLKTKIGTEFPKQADSVAWKVEIEDAQLPVDPQLLSDALLELFGNAFEHPVEGASLHFNATTESGNLVLTLYEPKPQFELGTENWGREPLRHVNRGHYGLGLNRARTIVEGHGGKLRARYDSTESKLITSIILPLAERQG